MFCRDNPEKTEFQDHQVNQDPVELPETKDWLVSREIKELKDELETQDLRVHPETKEKMVLPEIKVQLDFKGDPETQEK